MVDDAACDLPSAERSDDDLATVGDLAVALPSARAGRVLGDASTTLRGVTHDSRRVSPGVLFACVRGDRFDGHRFGPDAIAAGAAALLVDHPLDVAAPQLVVDDTRLALGPASAAVYGHPSSSLAVVGVTGTNGKTTTTHLLAAIFEAAGQRTGILGTLSGGHTTPEAPALQQRLAESRDRGASAVVMEVSSHALAMHRVDGTHFAAAVFTNLGRDHLDLHHSVEEYFRAKAALFAPGLSEIGVTNTDDAHGRLLADAAPIPMFGFSLADASDIDVGAGHHSLTWRGVRIRVGLGGTFNVLNTLAAATTAAALGLGLDAIVEGLATAGAVPGRFERIDTADLGFDVVVDYAHTPDGLAELVGAARAVVPAAASCWCSAPGATAITPNVPTWVPPPFGWPTGSP
ncbi:MAG: Mur ligase family protein [Desertimonas sp.]